MTLIANLGWHSALQSDYHGLVAKLADSYKYSTLTYSVYGIGDVHHIAALKFS